MLEPKSSAEVFFDKIMSLPETDRAAYLRKLVNSNPPTYEEEWRDFKGASKISHDDVKKTWSKALSGFGNTEGGVLLWGIDARKTGPENLDAASGLSYVVDPLAFKSRLMELHHTATEPPVAGVRVEPIPDPANSREGFVICLIPESRAKPHRAEYCAGKPYYIRAGDNFVMPSPALLRNLFYPHIRSHLWVEVAVTYKRLTDVDADVRVELRLHNAGPATAREILVVVQSDEMPGLPGAQDGWALMPNAQGFGIHAFQPLHPGSVTRVFVWVRRVTLPSVPGFVMRCLIYAADREPEVATVAFDTNEILSEMIKKAKMETGVWNNQTT